MLGLYLRFHARFIHATLIGVMLNFWKVGVAPTTPLYTKTPPLLRTTNKDGKVLFCQRAISERRGTREVRPISNTLATLAPTWWPELVLTTCLGSKCPCDSQMAARIMEAGGMPLQGLILQLEEIIPHILCRHFSCFRETLRSNFRNVISLARALRR